MKDLRLVYFSSVKWMSSALWIFITLTNWGCTSEDDMLHVTMKDGNKILVGSCPKFYDSEQSFIHSVSFPAMEDCQTYNVENIDYEINLNTDLGPTRYIMWLPMFSPNICPLFLKA